MPGAGPRPDHAFAIQNNQQYQPAATLGDQHIEVRDYAGSGFLLCHASRPLDTSYRDVERLFVVVHGALRDSDRYLGHARAAAEQVASRTLIVAPQFLADVDIRAHADAPDAALYWDVEGWKSGENACGPTALQDSDSAALLLEVSPPAMAQGANRLERGIYYDEHVRRLARAAGLSAQHQLIRIPAVGHSAADVLIAPQVRNAMFE